MKTGPALRKTLKRQWKNQNFVRASLLSSGFVINDEKSVWEPTQKITWLGVKIELKTFILKITDERIKSIKETLQSVINALPYFTSKKFSFG